MSSLGVQAAWLYEFVRRSCGLEMDKQKRFSNYGELFAERVQKVGEFASLLESGSSSNSSTRSWNSVGKGKITAIFGYHSSKVDVELS